MVVYSSGSQSGRRRVVAEEVRKMKCLYKGQVFDKAYINAKQKMKHRQISF